MDNFNADIDLLLKKADSLIDFSDSYKPANFDNTYDYLKYLFNYFKENNCQHQFYNLRLAVKFFLYCIDKGYGTKMYLYESRSPKIKDKKYTQNKKNIYGKSRKLEHGILLYNNEDYVMTFDIMWCRFFSSDNPKNKRGSISMRSLLFSSDGSKVLYHFIPDDDKKLENNKEIKLYDVEITDEIKEEIVKNSEPNNYIRGIKCRGVCISKDITIDENYFDILLKIMFSKDENSNEDNKEKNLKKLDELKSALKFKKKLGQLGEVIVCFFEYMKDFNVEYTADKYFNAGYDILSKKNNVERYIEVKAGLSDSFNFHLSSGEYEFLKDKKSSGYIYYVSLNSDLLSQFRKVKIADGDYIVSFKKDGEKFKYSFKNDADKLKDLFKGVKIYTINNVAKKISNLSKIMLVKDDKFEIKADSYEIIISDDKLYKTVTFNS